MGYFQYICFKESHGREGGEKRVSERERERAGGERERKRRWWCHRELSCMLTQSIGSQVDCCHGNSSKLIYRSAANHTGCWLCVARLEVWPRIRVFDWDKDGTGGSFLTLEQDGETNTFCLSAEAIAVNNRLPAKAPLVPARPTQWQACLG